MVDLYQTRSELVSSLYLKTFLRYARKTVYVDAKSIVAPDSDRKLIEPTKIIAVAALVGIELGCKVLNTHIS